MYCENTGGQAYIDAGLYDRLPPPSIPQATQKSVEITATQTKYEFSCGQVDLSVKFLSPLLVTDLDLYSRPITYVTFNLLSNDNKEHRVSLFFDSSPDLAKNKSSQIDKTTFYIKDEIAFQKTGTKEQPVLKRKGDDVRIDWGYAYMAAQDESGLELPNRVPIEGPVPPGPVPDELKYSNSFSLEINLGNIKSTPVERTILLAYDDLYSIQYFGQNLQAWWKKNFSSAGRNDKEIT